MIKYKKVINAEKLYNEMKVYPYTFYMSLKERMAKIDHQNLRRGDSENTTED